LYFLFSTAILNVGIRWHTNIIVLQSAVNEATFDVLDIALMHGD